MIKSNILLIFFLLLFSSNAYGTSKGWGIGFIAGEPTGINLKKWKNSTNALVSTMAWSLKKNKSFQFHFDYLFHNYTLSKKLNEDVLEPQNSPIFYGVGLRFKLKKEINNFNQTNDKGLHLGVRFPVGLTYIPKTISMDIFAEFALVLDLYPGTILDYNTGIGLRYYFYTP